MIRERKNTLPNKIPTTSNTLTLLRLALLGLCRVCQVGRAGGSWNNLFFQGVYSAPTVHRCPPGSGASRRILGSCVLLLRRAHCSMRATDNHTRSSQERFTSKILKLVSRGTKHKWAEWLQHAAAGNIDLFNALIRRVQQAFARALQGLSPALIRRGMEETTRGLVRAWKVLRDLDRRLAAPVRQPIEGKVAAIAAPQLSPEQRGTASSLPAGGHRLGASALSKKDPQALIVHCSPRVYPLSPSWYDLLDPHRV